MPITPYIFNANHIIIKRKPGYLEMETGSGRTILLLFIIFVLLFQEDWLKVGGILACLISMTYSKRWIFDEKSSSIRGVGMVVGLKYDDLIEDLRHVTAISIESEGSPIGVGNIYRLRIRLEGDLVATIAVRNYWRRLIGMVRDMKRFLPDVPLTMPQECEQRVDIE